MLGYVNDVCFIHFVHLAVQIAVIFDDYNKTLFIQKRIMSPNCRNALIIFSTFFR